MTIHRLFFLTFSVGSVFFLSVLPVHAFSLNELSLKTLVDVIIAFVGGGLIPLVIGVLFLVFIVNIILYFYAINTGQEKSTGALARKRLLYPLLTIFVVFTLWGFVYMLRLVFTS